HYMCRHVEWSDECIRHGLLAAYMSIQSLTAVPETVSLAALKALEQRWPE
ncbi:pseudouridine-metabolizing bifunctional protein C1861.05, partial [Biomphalaria pfeifferi]